MAELENIFSRLDKIFSAVKIKYVIVGGIAVHLKLISYRSNYPKV